MGVEIERKFLVKKEIWEQVEKPVPKFLKQGYIQREPTRTVRVRVAEEQGFLTIKGKSTGAVRAEFEYTIPKEEALVLLETMAEACLEKYRYEIEVGKHVWEVDVFNGTNEGLVLAEIELENEHEVFSLPDWAGKEVTDDKRYYNSNLGQTPYTSW